MSELLAIGIEVARVTSWDFTRRMTAPAGGRI